MKKTVVQFLKKLPYLSWNKKFAIFLFLLVGVIFVPFHVSYAQSISAATLNMFFVILASIMSVLAQAIGKMIVLTISIIVIPLLGYNNFGSSNIISIGWPLVRDIVNMFVIVVLIFIAIKTMIGFGGNKVAWEQQIPKVFLAVIAVNFSRTICVLLIDAGQVVMMTFVNALRDIAAGNFVELFQLDSFLSMSTTVLFESNTGGAEAWGYLGSAYFLVILLGLVLATLWILAFVFIYRIVILWVLVIMSPLAFFLGGVKEVFGEAAGKYGDWWKQFVGAVTLGPIMAFFLWLGLAAASQGSIAASEGFNLGAEADSTYGLLNEIFQVEKLLSLFIGYVIIMAGFKAASSASGALGGIAGQLISEDMGKTLGKRIAMAPAQAGYKVGAAGARQVERRTGIGSAVGEGISLAGGKFEQTFGVLGSPVGSLARTVGGGISSVADTVSKEDRTASTERVVAMSSSTAASLAMLLTNPNQLKESKRWSGGTMGKMDDLQEIAFKISTDKEFAKDIESKVGKAEFKKIKATSVKSVLDNADDYIQSDDKRKGAVGKLKQKNLHLLKDEDIQKVVDDDEFRVGNVGDDAMKDARVRQVLANKALRTFKDPYGNDVTVSAFDDAQKGIGVSQDAKTAANEPIDVDLNYTAITDKNKKEEAKKKINSYTVSKSLQDRRIDLSTISVAQVTDPDKGKEVLDGIANSGLDLDTLDAAVKVEVESYINDKISKSTAEKLKPKDDQNKSIVLSPQMEFTLNAAHASSGGDLSRIGVNVTTGSVANPAALKTLITSNPEFMKVLERNVTNYATAPTEATKVVASAMTQGQIRDWANEAVQSADAKIQAAMKENIEAAQKAIEYQYTIAQTARVVDKELERLRNSAQRAIDIL